MKSSKKSTSLFLIIFMSVILVVGLVFAFIPMNFGSTKYLSFAGNIKYASELKAGMYAEYTASGDVTLHVPRLKGISFETAIIER